MRGSPTVRCRWLSREKPGVPEVLGTVLEHPLKRFMAMYMADLFCVRILGSSFAISLGAKCGSAAFPSELRHLAVTQPARVARDRGWGAGDRGRQRQRPRVSPRTGH